MALAYNYSNNAVETALAGSVSSSATNLTVGPTTGFPTSTPYVLAVGYGAADEELVKVTAIAGSDLTVERGFGGTSAQSHSLGAKVRHVVNAVDLIDFRQHEDDSTGVHGLTGTVVGTSDTQTLSNKTLTTPTVNGGALSGAFSGAPTLTGDVAFTGTAPSFAGAVEFTGTPSLTAGFALAGTAAHSGSAGEAAYTTRVTDDPFPRLAITAAGVLTWGGGDAAGDTILYRSGADTLATTDQFEVTRPTAAHDVVRAVVDGEAQPRFLVEAGGTLGWGDGTQETLPIGLSRTGADELTLTGKFQASVETDDTFTAAAGFTKNAATLRKTCGVAEVTVYVRVTDTIPTSSEGSPNIVDTVMGTIGEGYRPTSNYEATWSTGLESGSAVIGSDGVITLRTSDYSTAIQEGTDLRVSATYIP